MDDNLLTDLPPDAVIFGKSCLMLDLKEKAEAPAQHESTNSLARRKWYRKEPPIQVHTQ